MILINVYNWYPYLVRVWCRMWLRIEELLFYYYLEFELALRNVISEKLQDVLVEELVKIYSDFGPPQAFLWYFYRPDLHSTFLPSGTATAILEVCKRGLRYRQELQVGKWDLSASDIKQQINLNRGNKAVPSQAVA